MQDAKSKLAGIRALKRALKRWELSGVFYADIMRGMSYRHESVNTRTQRNERLRLVRESE